MAAAAPSASFFARIRIAAMAFAWLASAGYAVGKVVVPQEPDAVDLSPRAWPVEDRQAYAQSNLLFGQPKPLAVGERGMVVGTTGALAIRAGLEALNQGGSAVDAAFTTALSQIVLSAGSWNSFAGILGLVYYDAKSGQVYALDACYDVPLEETQALTIPAQPQASGRTALVPGFMAGLEAAHERFGKLAWESLFTPAVYFAEEGVEVNAFLAGIMQYRRNVLTRLEPTKLVFLKADGSFPAEGDNFQQPALASTLRTVAEKGAAHMYTGTWAERFVAAVRAEGGKLTMEDLARYEPLWHEPLRTTYRGHEVYTLGAPGLGGPQIVEALNLMEFAEVDRFEHYTRSPHALHALIQIARVNLAFSYLPEVVLKLSFPALQVTAENRATEAHAEEIWDRLSEPGWLQEFEASIPGIGGHSDAVVAIDAEGNVAAMIHTINTSLWGQTGIFVDGISIPDSAAIQQTLVAAAGPGKRLGSQLNPALVFEEGECILASSTIGSGLHSAALQNLHNVLDHGMNPKQAAETPYFGSPNWGDTTSGSLFAAQVVAQGRFDAKLLQGVRALGQKLTEVEAGKMSGFEGYWIGIRRHRADGRLEGGLIPNFNGLALGR